MSNSCVTLGSQTEVIASISEGTSLPGQLESKRSIFLMGTCYGNNSITRKPLCMSIYKGPYALLALPFGGVESLPHTLDTKLASASFGGGADSIDQLISISFATRILARRARNFLVDAGNCLDCLGSN